MKSLAKNAETERQEVLNKQAYEDVNLNKPAQLKDSYYNERYNYWKNLLKK